MKAIVSTIIALPTMPPLSVTIMQGHSGYVVTRYENGVAQAAYESSSYAETRRIYSQWVDAILAPDVG